MNVGDAVATLESIAPLRHAQSWDNVGLLVGDPDRPVSRVLLTIDYTAAVAREATALGCDFVVAYHPPIFQPLKRVVAGDAMFDAIRRGVAIYSPHTALDVAAGGTNDVLADALGLEEVSPLRPEAPVDGDHKLVVFVPEDSEIAVCDALFAAGAGRIGRYTSCSFRSSGRGTFFGEEGANPAVGAPGQLESVEEIRVEMVVPAARAAAVVAALRRAHPYEEPAFDLLRTAPKLAASGSGRIGRLSVRRLSDLIARVKAKLGVGHVLVASGRSGDLGGADLQRGAVCAGACGDHLRDAARRGADVYLTGELRHHDALWAAEAGIHVLCVLHSNSERATLTALGERLTAAWPGTDVHLSAADRDPFVIV